MRRCSSSGVRSSGVAPPMPALLTSTSGGPCSDTVSKARPTDGVDVTFERDHLDRQVRFGRRGTQGLRLAEITHAGEDRSRFVTRCRSPPSVVFRYRLTAPPG